MDGRKQRDAYTLHTKMGVMCINPMNNFHSYVYYLHYELPFYLQNPWILLNVTNLQAPPPTLIT